MLELDDGCFWILVFGANALMSATVKNTQILNLLLTKHGHRNRCFLQQGLLSLGGNYHFFQQH
jgi:hypothetical protein